MDLQKRAFYNRKSLKIAKFLTIAIIAKKKFKISQNGQNDPKSPKMLKIAKNCPKSAKKPFLKYEHHETLS